MAQNAATTISQMAASDPPATITSASPRRMMPAASPMPWLDEAQALTVA
jgi:hypothetical protein